MFYKYTRFNFLLFSDFDPTPFGNELLGARGIKRPLIQLTCNLGKSDKDGNDLPDQVPYTLILTK